MNTKEEIRALKRQIKQARKDQEVLPGLFERNKIRRLNNRLNRLELEAEEEEEPEEE